MIDVVVKMNGKIYFSEQGCNFFLRFVGDVRVTLCAALNTYVEKLFSEDEICSVVIDLRKANAVDSTTLGLLARIALHTNEIGIIKPILLVKDASMFRLVESMGFDEIFSIQESFPDTCQQWRSLPCTSVSTDEAREQVIEAHKILMSMNNKNMNTFSDLVSALEQESSTI